MRTALWREPLLHFLSIGVLLYAAAAFRMEVSDPDRIVVDSATLEQLNELYRQQFGMPPDEQRLRELVKNYVREEALFRQGKALGLADKDIVIRRRIAQKMEFLNEGGQSISDASEQQLQEFYRNHVERYRQPATVSFKSLYFAPDHTDNAEAKQRAITALHRLQQGDVESAEGLADPLPDLMRMEAVSEQQVRRHFGEGELVQALFTAPTGAWSGPFHSGYGWHVVWVELRAEGQLPDLAKMREQVLDDWRQEQRREQGEQSLRNLLARYEIVWPPGMEPVL